MQTDFILQNRLKMLRAEQGLTQADLAEKVGVSRQTIISIEKGDYVPSALLAFTIALALKADVNKVFYLLPNLND